MRVFTVVVFYYVERTEIILINFFINTCQKLERH